MEKIRGKGVDVIAVIASNDAFVMSAWGKVNQVKDSILMLSDPDAKFSKSIGWDMGVSPNRTARYAIIIDHGWSSRLVEKKIFDQAPISSLVMNSDNKFWLACMIFDFLGSSRYSVI